MKTAYYVLTFLMCVPLSIFVALVIASIMPGFNKKSLLKWKAICCTVLAIMSIPRAILAMQLGRDDVIIYWIVVVSFSISAFFSWKIYKE